MEADVSRFSVGQPVTFNVDAYPDRLFTGTVKQIRKAPKTIQNIVTYVVVISTENPDEVLLPGMTANLQVVVAKRGGVLKVPNMALRFRPPGQLDDVSVEAGSIQCRRAGGCRSGICPRRQGPPNADDTAAGITDGRVTEVLAGDLREGQRVITGTAPQSAPEADVLVTKSSSAMRLAIMALIETQLLRHSYRVGDTFVWAVDGISIAIERGEFVAVMGPSGSGKSTFCT